MLAKLSCQTSHMVVVQPQSLEPERLGPCCQCNGVLHLESGLCTRGPDGVQLWTRPDLTLRALIAVSGRQDLSLGDAGGHRAEVEAQPQQRSGKQGLGLAGHSRMPSSMLA